MKSRTTRKFRQLFLNLPVEIRDAANSAYLQFSNDPFHPSLRFKKVHATQAIYSARVNIDYRVVGAVNEKMCGFELEITASTKDFSASSSGRITFRWLSGGQPFLLWRTDGLFC